MDDVPVQQPPPSETVSTGQPVSSPPPPSSSKLFLFLGGVALLLLGTGGGFYFAKSTILDQAQRKPQPKACTQEVKLCPDGSSVGRTGPNCEFAPCPTPADQNRELDGSAVTANWKTYTSADDSFTFRYPNDWVPQENQVFGSRSVTEFRFQNNPVLEVSLIGNYNQLTGQPFKDIEEYVGIRKDRSSNFSLDGYQAKMIIDPGEPGHVIPYEEILALSADMKTIISLYFEPDYYPTVKENKIFDQILYTFRFD